MKKFILLSAALLFLSVKFVSAQKQDPYTCFYLDYDNDSIGKLLTTSIDSSINYLLLAGVESKEALEQIFSTVSTKVRIKKIDIINYSDNALPASIKDFQSLTDITFSACPNLKFKKVFRDLAKIKSLNSLTLDDNGRAETPANISHLTNLQSLTITNYDNVDASNLLENIATLPLLRDLTLASNNDIKPAENTILPKGLKTLDISDNGLGYLPSAISSLRTLTSLNISLNSFTDLEKLVNLLDSLPLKTLTITCFDKKDSLLILKSFPETQLEIAIYHELPGKYNVASTTTTSISNPLIENYYKNTIVAKVGQPDNARKSFAVDVKQPTTLYYYTGTSMKIPENAFVDDEGNAVKGTVNILYKEYNDAVDIFANGIPMTYDSAGEKLFFQSAGMFEMYAVQNDKILKLAPGKSISLDFATLDTSAGYNFYRLSEQQKNWEYKQSLQQNFTIRKRKYSSAFQYYPELYNMRFDTTSFTDRYNDSVYARTYKLPREFFKAKYSKALVGHFFKVKRIYKYNKNKEYKKQANFILNIEKYADYKELACFKNYVWVYDGPLNKKEFSKNYVTRKKWTDVRIVYEPSENVFNIELKSPHELVTLQAYPIKQNYSTDYEKYASVNMKLDNRYSKSLKKVQSRFDNNIAKRIARFQKKIWEKIDKNKSPEEKEMSRDEWIAYAQKRYKAVQDSTQKIQATQYIVTRPLQIDGFGIWNCDQEMRMKQPVQITAEFKDVYDKSFEPATVFVIDETIKGVLTYYFYSKKGGITLDPNSETALYIIDVNGKAAVVDKTTLRNELISQKDKDSFTFTAAEINARTFTTSELRKTLGF